MRSALVGLRLLLRASVRQEWRSFLPWVLGITVLSASSILAYPITFPTDESRHELAVTVGANPALSIIFGPAHDLSTADGFNAWRSLALGGFLTALMAIFVVVRASRAQEDSGQAELLASGVMGRATRLAVAVGLAGIASVAVGVVSAVVTTICGGEPEAAWLIAATFVASGWMFGAVAAVTAQLGSDARTATTLAVATTGTFFFLRGYLDSADVPSWTVWLTPQGWLQETRPATGDRWWPLLLAVALTVVLLVVAFVLQARRDFGQGVVAPRPGPEEGRVRSVWTLAWQLNAAPLVSWTVALVLLGAVFGSLATSVPDLLAGDAAVSQVLAAGATTPDEIVRAFLVTIFALLGIIASISGVQTMAKVRSEEMGDRVEPLLAGAVRRRTFLAANVVVALVGPTVGFLGAGAALSIIAGTSDLGVGVADILLQAAATAPAVWSIVALSVLVLGVVPRAQIIGWLGVVVSLALTLLGPTLGLDDVVLAVSPFWHVPNTGADVVDGTGLVGIAAVTAMLLVAGFVGFRRRDVARA